MSIDTLRAKARTRMQAYTEGFDWTGHTTGRQRIIESFLRLATTEGYNAVTMRRLAREIEVKPPTIYAHFPNGRDEIVVTAIRWFFYRFGTALIEATDVAPTVDAYWDALVGVHVRYQLELPESHLWDLIHGLDRVAHFLPREARDAAEEGYNAYLAMYQAAADEMGFGSVETSLKVIITVIDGVNTWYAWDGSQEDLLRCTQQAIAMSRDIVRLGLSPVKGSGRAKRTALTRP